ncbi:MAG TPA: hypothetical protein PKD32_03890 [Saprospiraceae bacterium]|nr:hypothetical protein [Saprospiraceae bacterium]
MKNSIVFLFFALIALTSCEKDCSSPAVQDNEALLTKPKGWKFITARSILNGVPYYYERGSQPQDFDGWTFTFYPNHTGVLKTTTEIRDFTYNWLDPEKTKFSYTSQQPDVLNAIWENLNVSETKLSYTEYINSPSRISMSTMNLIPIE